ncbi:sulfotransferase [Burkholderia sp. MBR-1]|uniref:sulfotransferase n=1 Tax=Burkholderia sp. MBR-1 TaxID=2732364 RepID=UPI0015EEC73B|nr:sulfotransferase [Burkholderia sp. MBR-1]QMI49032.1 hypothetical protein MBR110_26575 [Burkholderia sp. MBR-1]
MLKSLPCMEVLANDAWGDDAVTVVSGLPRSGTSMLMRVLAFGGIEPLTDHIREGNSRNPHGYFEWEPIKERHGYVNWIDSAAGKAVKAVSRFVRHLPATRCYSILFLHRDLDEIVRSQRDMALHLSDASWDDAAADKLKDVYRRHVDETLAWTDARPNMRLHTLHYESMLAAPTQEIDRIRAFLAPRRLDMARMLTAVDPTLNHAASPREASHA